MALKSLKSRYILSTVLLLLVTALILTWASINIKSSSDKSLENVNNRRILQLSSSKIRDSIWQTDFYVNTYRLTPSRENRQHLFSSLDKLVQDINKLAEIEWSQSRKNNELITELGNTVAAMNTAITSLIEIREDQEKRFPSLSIIHNKLYPANLEFVTLSSLALEEIPIEQLSPKDAEFYRLLADTQRIWQRMIASFRLFVAYRSGTISNPGRGMTNELDDINTLYAGVMNNLHQLNLLNRTDLPSIQDNETIDEMIYIAENWHDNFQAVSEIHTSGEWRKDDVLIREQLNPLSQQIRQLLYQLDGEIDQSILLDVRTHTELAESIIGKIWLLGAAMLLFIIGGYFYLRNRVLQPISSVASGLLEKSKHNENLQLQIDSTREVNNLVTAFNKLSESLAQAEAVVRHTDKMSVVGQLASGVAHEINNPLNNMARLTEFIEEEVMTDRTNENLRDDFKILHHEMDRCAAIVKNLLDFGKPAPPKSSTIQLDSVILESIRLLKHQAQDKNLQLITEIPDELPDIHVDPSQIHQVLVNLLLNAIYFSPAGERITVTLETSPHELTCRIIDSGPGADETQIEQFFDPFYTTRKGLEGSGLGLSVCYSIIQHHHGKIGAHSGEHGGLVVWFSLPITNKLPA